MSFSFTGVLPIMERPGRNYFSIVSKVASLKGSYYRPKHSSALESSHIELVVKLVLKLLLTHYIRVLLLCIHIIYNKLIITLP